VKSRRFSIGAIVALTLLLGCAPLRPILTSPEDYAAYRSFRLAHGDAERFATSGDYVKAHASGAFIAEVGGWYRSHERALATRALHEVDDARTYLRVLPEGPHREEVARFLAAWEREQIERPQREARALEAQKRAAERAAIERAKVTGWIERWIDGVSAMRSWSRDAASAVTNDPAIFALFRGDEDPGLTPACDAFACRATRAVDVELEDSLETTTLRVRFSMRAMRAREGVESMMLSLGHDGFARWLDADEGHPHAPTDARRAEALTFAKNRVERQLRKSGACTADDTDRSRTIVCAHVGAIIASDAEDVIAIFPTVP
jgi:hypothetical protein